MKKRFSVMAILLCLAVTGCADKKVEKPITSSATSNLEDEDPVDELAEDDEDEIPTYDVTLPKDLSEFTIAIWGENYEFPLSYEEFTEKGWEYKGKDTDTVAAETYIESEAFENEGNRVETDIMNTAVDESPISDCMIAGIHVDATNAKSQGVYINLPGDIIFMRSSEEDITKAYGAAVDRYEEGNLIQLTYEFGHNKTVKLGIDKESDTLVKLDMQNFHNPAEDEALADVVDEVTPEVLAYKKPTEMPLTLDNTTVTYGGNLYQIPAPVSEFQKNGWKVNEQESDRALREGKYGYVTLERDGEKLYSMVKNFGEKPTTIKSCFVTNVYGDMDTTKVPIEAAGGITLGITEKSFLELVKNEKYEKSGDEEQKLDIYSFYLDAGKVNGVMVYIDRDLKLVRQIQVVNDVIPEEETDSLDSQEDSNQGLQGATDQVGSENNSNSNSEEDSQ